MVALLIEKCEIDICDSDNSTALIKASQGQHEECVTLLLKYGADPNVRDAGGNAAIHYAIYSDNVPMAATLLAYNASIESQTKGGLTPLLLALKENKQQMAEFLIENKANIHAVDELNRSTLMYAVQCESKHMVKFLLQQGVDVFLKDVFGCPASYYALGAHCKVIKKTLSKYEENKSIPCNYPGKRNVEVMLEEEQNKPDGRKNIKSQVTPNKKKHKRTEMKAALQMQCYDADAALAIEDGSAPPGNGHRKRLRATGNGEQNFLRSAPFWTVMEEKESGSENWTSRDSVSMHENSISITSDLVQMTDGHSSTEIDQDEGRSNKKTLKQTHQVRKQIRVLKDHAGLALSYETDTDDDAGGSLHLVDLLHLCDRLIECKTSQYELLSRKIKIMENKVSGPQEEILDIEEVKSQIEEGEMELDEISHMRILSQHEDVEKDDDQYFGNTETILRAKEMYNEEEMKQLQTYVTKLYTEVKDLKLDSKQPLFRLYPLLPNYIALMKMGYVKEKLDTASTNCPHLEEDIQCLEQDLLSIKSIQKEWEHLEKNQEDLEEKFLTFKDLIHEYMKQNEDPENLRQLSDCNTDSTISEMIFSLKDLEIELFKMKADSQLNKSEVKKYNQLFKEEAKSIVSLLSELKKTEEELEAANRKCLLKKEKRSLHSSHRARSVLEKEAEEDGKTEQ